MVNVQTYVTIGTDNAWAQAKLCHFALTDVFAITNTEQLTWDIEGKGKIVKAAVFIENQWWELAIKPIKVKRNEQIKIGPGDLRIDVIPPTTNCLSLEHIVQTPESVSELDGASPALLD